MSEQQLEMYRATRRRRAADDAEQRRARAEAGLLLAREAAALLRSRFGASEVYLFGSLAEGDAFGMASDIDLAARGLGPAHYAALGRLLSLSADFEFDLIDLDTCPPGLRDAVMSRGVPL